MTNHSKFQASEVLINSDYSYSGTILRKQDYLWKKIGNITVIESIDIWLSTLSPLTRKNYASAFRQLISYQFVEPGQNLQRFSLINHENIIDEIKLFTLWKEATRQARAAAYISFTGYLQRKTQGLISKTISNREGTAKTFYKIREKVKTKALTVAQTKLFLKNIEKINKRDALIAKVILQGGKRKSEVLELVIKNINFEKRQICFRQTKTKGILKETVITYPDTIFSEIKKYIGKRTGLVFVTRNGKKIHSQQLDRTFVKAGQLSEIPFRTTPHVLRATLVTRLKEKKVQDTDIMKITGHVSPVQISAYDKTDIAENASRYYNLVE
jgi:integrase/recombinase XerD